MYGQYGSRLWRNYLIDFETAGIYYLMVATFAGMFGHPFHLHSATDPFHPQDFFSKTYHFSPGVGGLAYLGLGIGFISAMIFGARFADQIYKDVNIYLRMTEFLRFPIVIARR